MKSLFAECSQELRSNGIDLYSRAKFLLHVRLLWPVPAQIQIKEMDALQVLADCRTGLHMDGPFGSAGPRLLANPGPRNDHGVGPRYLTRRNPKRRQRSPNSRTKPSPARVPAPKLRQQTRPRLTSPCRNPSASSASCPTIAPSARASSLPRPRRARHSWLPPETASITPPLSSSALLLCWRRERTRTPTGQRRRWLLGLLLARLSRQNRRQLLGRLGHAHGVSSG